MRKFACLALAAGLLAAPSARAAYVATFEQVGANVVEVGGGTIDLTDLTMGINQSSFAAVAPEFADYFSGAHAPQINYSGLTGPTSWGPGSNIFASSSSGDAVALVGEIANVFVPLDYESGSPLSETSTYLGASIASLGLTPGAYVYSWGSGDHADTFTVNVVTSPPLVPEPSTWAMMLIGFGGLGYAALRRKSTVRVVSAQASD